MPKLIAQMVARNEGTRYLGEVLDHLSHIADLIVFTDDHSDDNTKDVAKQAGCHVFDTPWSESRFQINEGELRQYAWNNLTQFATQGDWILAIDADEKLYGTEKLHDLLDQSIYYVLGIEFYHMWNSHQYRIDKAWRPTISSRLFRFLPNGTFIPRKLACGSEPTYVQEMIRQRRAYWPSSLKMQHLGYVRDEDKLAKYKRYMALDGGNFHSRLHIESILDRDPQLVEWVDG